LSVECSYDPVPPPSRLDAETLATLRAYLADRWVPSETQTLRVSEPPAGLAGYLARADVPFSRHLLQLIRESGTGEVEIYKRARVDRKLFSKIRSDPAYQPKKTTVIAFALALRLSTEQTQSLLASAGYALSGSAPFDLIVRFFLEQNMHDPLRINDALYAFNQPLLSV
jgi:hypothetical protein